MDLFVTVLRKAPRSEKTLLAQSSVNIRKAMGVFIIFEFRSDEIDENVLQISLPASYQISKFGSV